MEDKIKKVLAEIRPYIQGDGGDIELIAVDQKKGQITVKLTGACQGCPLSEVTLKGFVEAKLKEKIPQIKEVIAQ